MRIVIYFTFPLLFSISCYSQTNVIDYDIIVKKNLLKALQELDAQNGVAILVKSESGKVLAVSGYKKIYGTYVYDGSLVDKTFELQSLMIPITLAVVWQHSNLPLSYQIKINQSTWKKNNIIITDPEVLPKKYLTLSEIISYSSSVGAAKIIDNTFKDSNTIFLKTLNLITNDILIRSNTSSILSNSVGKDIKGTPINILHWYNSVANGGIRNVLNDSSINKLQQSLQSVCKYGTASSVFRDISVGNIAGKTGTILVAKGQFLSAFVGYFPAQAPEYSCLVLIKNKPFSPSHYGATVAAPVFKNIYLDLGYR